jgi:hypothetical protein
MKKLKIAPIAVNGDDTFEVETSRIVEEIARSRTGQAIFEKIRAHGLVVIEPYTGNDLNARALINTFDLGTVIGRIEFSPATFATTVTVAGVRMPNYAALINPGFRPDQVLLHELVHAGRVVGHQVNTIKLTGLMAAYDNEEEFFAVVVANIYMSEKGVPVTFLRASHRLTGVLSSAKTASEVFLFADDNYRLIEKFCAQHPTLSTMLKDVQAPFNPIRAYYEARALKLPAFHEVLEPRHQFAQKDASPALTDDYLIGILKPKYHATDVAGYGARVRKLEQVFGALKFNDAIPLVTRLLLKNNGDLVAGYFHHHLATATRDSLMNILKRRMVSV